MSDIALLGMALLSGILLGALFFGGLRWTIIKGLASPKPAFWFMGSLLLRTGIVLAGFYFISGGSWKRLLACLSGFVIARIAVTRLASLPLVDSGKAKETGRAS